MKWKIIKYFPAVLCLLFDVIALVLCINKIISGSKEVDSDAYLFLTKTQFSYTEKIAIKDYLATNLEVIEYPKIDEEKLGKQIINVVVQNKDLIEVHSFEIEVIDNIKPILHTNLITVVESEEIDLAKYLDIEDKSAFFLNPTHIIATKNEEKIEIIDAYGNKTEALLQIELKPKKADIIKQDIIKQESENSILKKSNIPQNYKVKKPVSKFLFQDGYDFNTAQKACEDALNKLESGKCIPLKQNDLFKGYELYLD